MRSENIFPKMNSKFDFKEIDRHLLVGLECSQYNHDSKKFLSMIKEQTISAIRNKKYLAIKS